MASQRSDKDRNPSLDAEPVPDCQQHEKEKSCSDDRLQHSQERNRAWLQWQACVACAKQGMTEFANPITQARQCRQASMQGQSCRGNPGLHNCQMRTCTGEIRLSALFPKRKIDQGKARPPERPPQNGPGQRAPEVGEQLVKQAKPEMRMPRHVRNPA